MHRQAFFAHRRRGRGGPARGLGRCTTASRGLVPMVRRLGMGGVSLSLEDLGGEGAVVLGPGTPGRSE